MNSSALAEPEVVVSADALTEVIDGEIVEKPMSAESTFLGGRLYGLLWSFAEESGAGTAVCEMMFVFDADGNQKRRPDVAFVAADRWPIGAIPPREGDWSIVPDIAIEVVSPNDYYRTVLDKVAEYFEYGVRQVWVVDPVRQLVSVYDALDAVRNIVAPATLETPLIPGWSLPLAKLFGNPPPT